MVEVWDGAECGRNVWKVRVCDRRLIQGIGSNGFELMAVVDLNSQLLWNATPKGKQCIRASEAEEMRPSSETRDSLLVCVKGGEG